MTKNKLQVDYPFFLHVIREAVSHLPEANERLCHGTPGFYAGKKIFARVQEDLASLAVYTKRKDDLLASNPVVYFTTPHFDGYDYVLVRLARVDFNELAKLLLEGWRERAPKRAIREYESLYG
ncbi:hypothetical protein JHJ32_00585 [Parapedobacter sp. ISTM3]|uniref:YjbR protein n=1 Tax=Parapedobacter luteus TaxID=623280 RepID=A0A1T5DB68_9SPHI|nr:MULTISPECIES: hypothetical protein [Parapedobacter]MBK1438468.1 hypothetical protein [Parapedobacter sp. ISTM3]SKB69038.1 hypothetical protein SAMN05660226_02678 [Parapedobacter luteus]